MIDRTNLTAEKAAAIALAHLNSYKNLKAESNALEAKVVAGVETTDERKRFMDITDEIISAKCDAMDYMRFVFNAENYECEEWIENELAETMQDLADISRGDY